MTETTPASPAPAAQENSTPVPENPALDKCLDAYLRAYKKAKRQRKSNYTTMDRAHKAYRNALPLLSGTQNIRDFVACLTHGMLIGAISGPDGTRCLYAAQVAAGIRTPPAPPKSPAE